MTGKNKTGNNKAEPQWRSRLFVFIPALLLCLGLLAMVLVYMRQVGVAAPQAELDLASWQMTLADGTPVAPGADGALDIAPGQTLYLTGALPGGWSGPCVLSLEGAGVDAAVLVDGELMLNPSGRFVPGAGFDGTPFDPAGWEWVCTFACPPGAALTVAVQFASAGPAAPALPQAVLYPDLAAYNDDLVSRSIIAALPTGVLLAAVGVLLLIFLMQSWAAAPDWNNLLLAGTALAFCLNRTVIYAVDQPFTSLLAARCLPLTFLPALLWSHLQGRAKKLLAPFALGGPGLMIALLFLNRYGSGPAHAAALQMQHRVLPLLFFALLAAGAAQAVPCKRRKSPPNPWYRRFYPLLGIVFGGMASLIIPIYLAFNWLTGARNRFLTYAPSVADMPLRPSFFPAAMRCAYLIFMVCLVLALLDFIQALMRQYSERQALELQNRFATEHAEALYRTLLETRAVRHEIRHQAETLRILCQQGDFDRVKAYVQQMAGESRIVQGLYSANLLVNALVAPRLQAAQDAGVEVSAIIQVPEQLPMADIDLSTLLINMLDNAVLASSAVPDAAARTLTLRMEYARGRLLILCRNSYTGAVQMNKDGLPASHRGEWHGQGTRLMRRVAEKYGGVLDVRADGSAFTLRTVLTLETTPPAPKT